MSSFRALQARPGALRLAAASGLGWWAFNGYGLALVLTIHHATGSFGPAGASIAAFAVGSAVLAPMRGRSVDRRGGSALIRLAVVHVGALGTIVVACLAATSPPPAVLLAGSAVAGATAPPLTAAGRRAWARLAGTDLARTAHAFNALLGETAALASPAVTSVIAVATSPVVALAALLPPTVIAAVGVAGALPAPESGSMTTIGSIGRGELNGRRGRAARACRSPFEVPRPQRSAVRDSAGLRWLVAGDLAVGAWLGALEVSAPALSVEGSIPLSAGLPFVALAAGGVAASAWIGSARTAGSPLSRYLAGMLGIATVMPLALLSPGVPALTAACAAAGLAYGLVNVALFELIDHVVDDARSTEAFTWLTTAQASGLALGAGAAGALADADPAHALALACLAPLVGAGIAIRGRSALATNAWRTQVQPSTKALPSSSNSTDPPA